MAYQNARDVLPPDVLHLVQRYVQGKCLYIPRADHMPKRLPSDAIRQRNAAIAMAYRSGQSVAALSRQYYLSPQAIYKILRAYRK